MPVVVRTACALLLAVPGMLVSGCGRDVPDVEEIAGAQVGAMAERELEAENPRLAPGSLDCPDLDLEVGASVRCERTATLSSGRLVKMLGTVRVTSLSSGGRLHVALDDPATEFGVTGEQVASVLRQQYQRLFHHRPGAVSCPYLLGEVGVHATCTVQVGDRRHAVDAVVSDVDATDYDVRYTFRRHPPS
jgi:hypothetical protein